ncbi:hypothetical protein BJX63DRAFT_121815 [Aspergillus granulosus]|uniref:Uncharacterized protein n=1 Tax=Aspergillus granulosus TaxID=176169 RepID=A0ABR4I4A8_9EURO
MMTRNLNEAVGNPWLLIGEGPGKGRETDSYDTQHIGTLVQRSITIPQAQKEEAQKSRTKEGGSRTGNQSWPSPRRYQEMGAIASLPFDISFEDKHLLHTYALSMSTEIYGTSRTPYFSSIRDLVIPTCHFAPLVLQWTLIEAEAYVRRNMDPFQAKGTFTLQRAIGAYQAINSYIETCNGNVTDELLSGIVMAIVTEFRLNGSALARVHMRGYEELVEMRGGIKKILLNAPVPLMLAGQIMPYIMCEPDSYITGPGLEVSVADTMCTLRIDACNPGFRAVLRDSQVRVLLSSRWLTPYLTFGTAGRDWAGLGYPQKANRFLSVYLVVQSLWRFREDLEYARFTVAQIHQAVAKSAYFDDQGRISLNVGGFMWAVVKALFDVDLVVEGMQTVKKQQAQVIISAVEVLKFFRGMGDQSRFRIVTYLCSLLNS